MREIIKISNPNIIIGCDKDNYIIVKKGAQNLKLTPEIVINTDYWELEVVIELGLKDDNKENVINNIKKVAGQLWERMQ